MKLFAKILSVGALLAVAAPFASATPITGSFGLTFGTGTYIGGSQTALTATGIDFGTSPGQGGTGSGNGFGTNGSAMVYLGTQSFAAFNNTYASIADISLGATANPNSNPFLTLGTGPNAILVTFSNGTVTRSATSIDVTGAATFADGTPADTTLGTFDISTSTQSGGQSIHFTFTGNNTASVTPEPSSLALLGTGIVGLAGFAKRRFKQA